MWLRPCGAVHVDKLRHSLLTEAEAAADPGIPADVRVLWESAAARGAPEGQAAHGAPEGQGYILQREVDLCRGTDQTPLVYAASWSGLSNNAPLGYQTELCGIK